MSNFFNDTMRGLLEAAEIKNGNIPIAEKKNMPASTFYVSDDAKRIEQLIQILKDNNMSQMEMKIIEDT